MHIFCSSDSSIFESPARKSLRVEGERDIIYLSTNQEAIVEEPDELTTDTATTETASEMEEIAPSLANEYASTSTLPEVQANLRNQISRKTRKRKRYIGNQPLKKGKNWHL